ncbi:MAG: glycosyltransferase family 4 protein [Cyclobacteriaceae bacterium]|nr:glycosyltransferase family 4 protein [Cyclobacteriaceae bacterium]MDW8330892.1 glycosyltransferase family 1 protein [Cyclobacteriaceae bacterium]
MVIGFDAKRLFQNFTGLGNYSRFVVNALQKSFPQHDYVLFTPKIVNRPDVQPFLNGEYSVVMPTGAWRALPSLWRTAGLSFTEEVKRLNIYHGLSHELPHLLPARVKKVLTVHDLIFYRFPEYYNPVDVRIYKWKLKSACKRADRIIAISRQTADDISSFLKVPDHKISVVYQGCHEQFRLRKSDAEIEQVKRKYRLPKQYLLVVGTIEQRKNAMVTVQALARLPQSLQLPLVLIGRKTKYAHTVAEQAEKLGVSDLVLQLDQVAFSDLPALYQSAQVFLYPSVFEGFGIPIIEAIWSGVPVITSTGSCFSEAGGPYTLYVSPHDPGAWSDAIEKVLSDEDLRKEMVEGSLGHVQRFRPETIARELMRVYSEEI